MLTFLKDENANFKVISLTFRKAENVDFRNRDDANLTKQWTC